MKKFRFVIGLIVVSLLFAPITALKAYAQEPAKPNPPTPLNIEEIQNRLKTAEELQVASDCSLPRPFVEGYPIDMKDQEDWTRVALCIQQKGVQGISWSAWPGSPTPTNPTQHFYSWWRLVDPNTGAVIFQTKVDYVNNPIRQGPPSNFISWMGHCGSAKDFALFLDIQARQIVGDHEVGLELRDHSWHFTLPAVPCQLMFPIIFGQPVKPPPLPCPANRLMKVKTDMSGEQNTFFSKAGGVIGSPQNPMLVSSGGKVTITFREGSIEVNAKKILSETGWSRLTLNGHEVGQYGRGPEIEIAGSAFPDYAIRLFEAGFLADNGKDTCWVGVYLREPL